MTHADLERTYELLARTIDTVGAARTEVFLAKLSLLLAHRLGDADVVADLINDAARLSPEETVR